MNALRQLPLPFPYQPSYHPEDFCTALSNESALLWLGRVADWPNGRLALWGGEGRGKTHLLRLWAGRNGATVMEGMLLAGLPDLPASGGIGLDDADAAPEEALFHLINAAAEAHLPLLLSGRTAPARWAVRLPDLASRLRATTAVEIGAPDEALLRSLLARLLADRQIAVAESVQDYLLTRLPRTAGSIREAAARLDRAALAAGGKVTRQIATRVAAEMGAVEDDEDDDAFATTGPVCSPVGPSLL